MSAIPTQTQAATSTNSMNKPSVFQLRCYLFDPNHALDDIHTHLNDEQHLSDTNLRALFGHIRRAFLKILWDQRQVELWTRRCKTLGRDYAQVMDESLVLLRDKKLEYAFYREQDESLDLQMQAQGEERDVVVAMVLNHVKLHREAKEQLDLLRREKASLLVVR